MFYRKQTLLLAICLIINIIFLIRIPVLSESPNDIYLWSNLIYTAISGLLLLLILISIFSYRNRLLQFIINRFSMMINLILLALFGYQVMAYEKEPLVGIVIPLLSIILLTLANKYVKKDEDLVKSIDRIR